MEHPLGERSVEGGQKRIVEGTVPVDGVSQRCAIAKPLNSEHVASIVSEASILRHLQSGESKGHKHVIRLLHYFDSSNDMALELVLPIGHDLNCVVNKHTCAGMCVPLTLLIHYFKQLVDAFRFIHGMVVIHRDVHLSQVLVDADDNVKVIDFGTAIRMDAPKPWGQLRSVHSAPEARDQEDYDTLVDLYGFGVILYELRMRKSFETLVIDTSRGKPRFVRHRTFNDKLERLARRNGDQVLEYDMLRGLLAHDPVQRLNLDRLEVLLAQLDESTGGVGGSPTSNGGDVPRKTAAQMERAGLARESQGKRFKSKKMGFAARVPEIIDGKTLGELGLGAKFQLTVLLVRRNEDTRDFGEQELETMPGAETDLRTGDWIFFGLRDHTPSNQTNAKISDEAELEQLRKALNGHVLSSDVVIGGCTFWTGCELQGIAGASGLEPTSGNASSGVLANVEVGAELHFNCDPKVQILRLLKLPVDSARDPDEHHVANYYFEFDCFTFPESCFGGKSEGVIGPRQLTDSTGSVVSCAEVHQAALDLRKRFDLNLAGIVRGVQSEEVEWFPGPRTVVRPGDRGLIVRAPEEDGTTTSSEENIEARLSASAVGSSMPPPFMPPPFMYNPMLGATSVPGVPPPIPFGYYSQSSQSGLRPWGGFSAMPPPGSFMGPPTQMPTMPPGYGPNGPAASAFMGPPMQLPTMPPGYSGAPPFMRPPIPASRSNGSITAAAQCPAQPKKR